jgi:hypothetical protein
MSTKKQPGLWLGRYPLFDMDHVPDLEQRAAILEFGKKLPRHEAEAKAHEDYRRDQLVESAAHHFVGMKAAHAAGATDHATKHAAMFALALKALGHDNTIDPPDEVKTKALHTPSEVYHFRAHPGDAFSIRAHEGEDKPLAKSELRKDTAGKPLTSVDAAPMPKPVESRRYGINGRVTTGSHAGKRNPYFKYDDYIPQEMNGEHNRPSGITIHQRGKEVIASLNHGYGDIRAFRRDDGGYALTYDGLKRAHPVVQRYRQHVIRALGDHLKNAHGAPYFTTGDEPSLQGPAN